MAAQLMKLYHRSHAAADEKTLIHAAQHIFVLFISVYLDFMHDEFVAELFMFNFASVMVSSKLTWRLTP